MSESLEEEIRTLRSLLWSERDPEGRVFAPLADAYLRAGETKEALDLLTDGTSRHPDFVSGHVVAAKLYLGQGMLSEAEISSRRALELDAENVTALESLAAVLTAIGQSEEAGSLNATLAQLDPDIATESPAAVTDFAGPGDEGFGLDSPPVALGEPPETMRFDFRGSDEAPTDVAPVDQPDADELGHSFADLEEVAADDTLGVGDFAPREGTPRLGDLGSDELSEPELAMSLDALAPDPEPEPAMSLDALAPDPEPEPAMSLDALAPDPEPEVSLDALAPDPEPELAMSLDALAPDPEPEPAMSLDALAPDPEPELAMSLDALAPDPEPEPAMSLDALAPDPEPEPAMSLDALAPDLEPELPMSLDALAPDPEPEPAMSLDALAPDLEPEPAMSLDALAPDPEPELAMSLDALAPDPEPEVSLDALAPDPEPELAMSLDALAPDPEPEPAMSLDALAPDPEPEVSLDALAPDPEPELAMSLDALAPDPEPEPAMSLDALAPDPEPELAMSLDALAPDPEIAGSKKVAAPVRTRTLAELYVKQGFTDKALEVLRQLQEQDPASDEIANRIIEIERGDLVPPAALAVASDVARATPPPLPHPDVADEIEASARDLAEGGPGEHEVDTPFAWTEAETEGAGTGGVDAPPIGDYFDALLGWEPRAPS